MGRVGRLAEPHRVDAALAWAGTLVVAGATARFVAVGDLEWAAFALLTVGVTLVPPLVARDPTRTFPSELVALVAAPVAVRAVGAFPAATPFLAAAGLALLSALALEAHTSLEVTPRFAVVITVITTMAFAGAWAVGTWIADATLGTAYLGGKTELMWDLTTATAMGLVAGVVFEGYFGYTDRLARLRADTAADRASGPPATASRDSSSAGSPHRLAVRGLQAILAGVVLLGLVRTDWSLLVNSALPLALTFLPGVLRRERGYPIDVGLALWVTVAATLHAVGALGLYEAFDWYDSLAHAVSGALVAGVGYGVARGAELHTEAVSFRPAFRGTFVLLFVLAVGVAWELLEFASGGLSTVLGGEAVLAQYGAGDIAKDLLFDAVGGVLVSLGSVGRFDGVARALAGRIGALVRRE